MKAVAVMESGEVKCVDIPKPFYSDYECLVRVRASGICSSTDLKLVHKQHPVLFGQPYIYPLILGHEGVGEIIEVGNKVRNLKVGDRVVNPVTPGHIPECGYHWAYGHMTEYSVAPDYRAMKEDGIDAPYMKTADEEIDFRCKVFPDDISYEDAVMIITFKENYSALYNFDVKPGMDVLIFGDGAVGMGLSLFLRSYNVSSVVIVGHHDDRLERIKRVSKPDILINSDKDNIQDVIGNKKFDMAIDAAGSIEIIKEAARLIKPCGKVCAYGVMKEGRSTLNLYDIPNSISLQILGGPYQHHRTHDKIIELMHNGFVKAKDFYSHVLPSEQVAEGIRMLETREALKVILTF
jgi:threonine dehydrogenase-like Zn-dependent dehydrogenase